MMEPSELPQRSALKPVLIGCGVLGLLALALLAAGIVWLIRTPESGVKMANEMDAYALEYLDKHKILNRGEKLLAYYDATISMNGTEAAILTDERVIAHKNGRDVSIPLRPVPEVRHPPEP